MSRNIPFIPLRRWWYSISLTFVVISIIMLSTVGLRYGLDFTGGSLLEVSYSKDRPSIDVVRDYLRPLDESIGKQVSAARIQQAGDHDLIIRLPELNEAQHQSVLKLLKDKATEGDKDNVVNEKRFEAFGSSLGNELKKTAVTAIIFVLIAIIVYLAYAFRKVSHPMPAWKFGAVAVIALVHDVIITVGLFSVLGYLYGTEVDSLFITALLTLLGFSVHDTIVTLDRTRENLFKHQDKTFPQLVNDSINETVTRSINTSMTTILSLVAIYIFGGESIRDFALALSFGIFIGTYSSIFIASPLLVTWYKIERRNAS